VHVTWRRVMRQDTLDPHLGSRIGRPMPDLAVHLLDADLNLVPAGVPGEIHVGGAGLARGYLDRPGLTAERFIPDPFAAAPGARLYRSGDLARRRPGGDLEVLGRRDHQVKVRGFRIELGEIEAALARHPAVREVVVMARVGGAKVAAEASAAAGSGPAAPAVTASAASLGTGGDGAPAAAELRLVAYLVPAVDAAAPSVADLRQFLKARVPEPMIPSAFVVLAELPLTAHGKVDRRALPEPGADRAAPEASFVAPRTAAETALAGIWSDVLGVAPVGVHDDFFVLGGHSLAAAKILARVRDALGAELSLAVLFEAPTIAGLAAALPAAPVTATAGPPDAAGAAAPAAAGHPESAETGESGESTESGETIESAALVAAAAQMEDADLDLLLAEMMAEEGAR
jgi:hypothetical protein